MHPSGVNVADKEMKVVLRRIGDDLAIPLPESFCRGTTLEEGTEVKVIYNKRGNLEVQVNRLAAEPSTCQICNTGTARYTCSICGTVACSTCFWEWGGLCHGCAKI